ncbi:cystathionine beta-lyase [Spectribacter hydrogenoxidans]|uniref:Cystathionine beta-lyase n=1 Tax=Spectribacter hydrogenoxidans TaxID=3075608 RepID=A0ABU3BXM0_9GAMM|nr:cystathionine beta-lyase [Salinisphaera sp. W335]MDT0634038.1 cystathionine beta-lyase [Salinisphaera sp. W335]
MDKPTRLVHGGREPRRQHGMVNPPVYHASTVIFPTVDALESAAANPFEGVYYGRFGTPIHFELEGLLAELEGGAGCVTTCSGLAAITVALMSVAQAGGHLLVADNIYLPTRKLCAGMLARLGMTTSFFDPRITPAALAELIRPETVALVVEAPGSLTFEMPDVPALAAVARAHDVAVIADNTWATPIGFPAFEHGVDISIQAATKYVVGHADAMLGAVTANESWYATVRRTAVEMGYCAGPDDVYLGLRGLRTLDVRLARHADNALRLCDWLAGRPEVEGLLYPPLPDDPGHAIWQRDFRAACGLFGVQLKPCSRQALTAMLDGLELFGMGFSWGGFESLVLPVNLTGARSATRWPHEGPLLRLHAGLESADDLIADLKAGFDRLASAT